MMFKKKYKFNKQIENYFIWPFVYTFIIFLLTVYIFMQDKLLGYISIMVLIVIASLSFILIYVTKKYLMSEVINFALDFGGIQKNFLYAFPIPYFLIDVEGKIKWYNQQFENIFEQLKLLDKTIMSIFPEITFEMLPKEFNNIFKKHIRIGNKNYKLEIQRLQINSDEKFMDFNKKTMKSIVMFAVYLFDETMIKDLQKKNKEQRAVVGLLYIDNYEEAIQSIEEVRRPLLVALIDRNINKFSQSIDAVVRKFEKDKYLIIFKHKHLYQLKDEKFTILDEVRDINIGNDMAVTLSVGIGVNTDSFQQSTEFARIAIDMALGRGGDQAVIKDKDKFYYYGGKTKVVEKSTRVKARVKAHAFRELLEAKDKIIIMGHKLQDLDSLGAALGIYRCAKTFNKKASIVVNEVTTSVRSLYEKIIEDDIYEEGMFINNIDAIGKSDDQTLLVVVDVNRPSYTECPELLELIPNIVVFDHHRASAEYIDNAVLTYVEPYASSTCEMVTEILQYIVDKIKLKPIEADALFAGITVDTKNFMVKTGVKTFEAAAFLRRNGADVVRVRKLFRNDMASYKARAEAIKNAEMYKENLAIAICPSENLESPTVVTAQTADELLNITGMKASFVITQIDKIVYISARSIDEINVQMIMEKMGGGGHLNVAGAQLIDCSTEEAVILLKENLNKMIEEGELVWK